jgi:hypothetical protein
MCSVMHPSVAEQVLAKIETQSDGRCAVIQGKRESRSEGPFFFLQKPVNFKGAWLPSFVGGQLVPGPYMKDSYHFPKFGTRTRTA